MWKEGLRRGKRTLIDGRTASRAGAVGIEDGEGAEEMGIDSGSATRGEVACTRGCRAEVAEVVRTREADEVPREDGNECECLCFD